MKSETQNKSMKSETSERRKKNNAWWLLPQATSLSPANKLNNNINSNKIAQQLSDIF